MYKEANTTFVDGHTFTMILLCLFCPVFTPTANDITCTESTCNGQTVTCNQGEPCNVICDEPGSCANAVIQCPTDHDCNVECIETSGIPCSYVTIDCPINGQCDILCTSDTTNAAACTGGIFNCPTFGDCNIVCSGKYACNIMTANCPDNGICTVNTTKTAPNGGTGELVAGQAKIYCPKNDYPCYLNVGSSKSYSNGVIYGGGGDLLIETFGQYAMGTTPTGNSAPSVYCPSAKDCNLTMAVYSSSMFIKAKVVCFLSPCSLWLYRPFLYHLHRFMRRQRSD